MGQSKLALENFKKAYELRDRTSDREKFYIASQYYSEVTGELEKGNQQYQMWIEAYPRDFTPHTNLGVNYSYLGQYDKAVEPTKEAIRLEPDEVLPYGNLGEFYMGLNRLDEAKATFDQAHARGLDDPNLRQGIYILAFLQNDVPGMQQQLAWAAGKPGVEDVFLSTQADTEVVLWTAGEGSGCGAASSGVGAAQWCQRDGRPLGGVPGSSRSRIRKYRSGAPVGEFCHCRQSRAATRRLYPHWLSRAPAI